MLYVGFGLYKLWNGDDEISWIVGSDTVEWAGDIKTWWLR